MKSKFLVLVAAGLLLITASCTNSPNSDKNNSSQSSTSNQFTSSFSGSSYNTTTLAPSSDKEESLAPYSTHPSTGLLVPIKLSTASIPQKYNYIPVGEDRKLAETILADFKQIRKNADGIDVPCTLDNACISYFTPHDKGRVAMQWVDILRDTHDIQTLVQKSEKITGFYYSQFDASEDVYKYNLMKYKYQDGELTRCEHVSIPVNDYNGYINAMNQLFNLESFEQLKNNLGVKNIKEIICFYDGNNSKPFFYYNTDKGEYVNAPHSSLIKNDKGEWVEVDGAGQWFLGQWPWHLQTLSDYIEEQTAWQKIVKTVNEYVD